MNRNLYFKDSIPTTHTSLAVSNTQTQQVHERQRIKEVQVGTVAGGTVTVQVYVDGRPMFLTGNRPVSGGAVRNPDSRFNFHARSIVTTVIEATSGAPTGSASVVTSTEPYVFVPKTKTIEITGKDRLFPSRQRNVAHFNVQGDASVDATRGRNAGVIGTENPDRATFFEANPQAIFGEASDVPLPDRPPIKPPKHGLG